MKLRFLSFALIMSMHAFSLNAAAPICLASEAFAAQTGQCLAEEVFNATTNPDVVTTAVEGAFETLLPAATEAADPGLAAKALATLNQALIYAQETGNYYLGDIIHEGLTTVMTYYEANPVATVTTGVIAVVTTAYIAKGCWNLMKRCCSACFPRRHKKAPQGKHLIGVHEVKVEVEPERGSADAPASNTRSRRRAKTKAAAGIMEGAESGADSETSQQ